MKKLIATILSISFCVGSVLVPAQVNASPNKLEASESVLSLEKHNFNFLEGNPGDTQLVYTYESNGSVYKVEESASDSFTEGYSTIYVMNDDGKFVEYATQSFTLDDHSNFTVITDENGFIVTETQKIPNTQQLDIPNTRDFPPISALSNDTYMGGPVTPWYYGNWTNGSTKFERYTVTAVTAVLFAVATAATSGTATIVVGTLGTLATTIVADEIPLLYYKRRYAEKKSAVATTIIVGSQWETKFYSDSNRTNELNRTTAQKFLDGYDPGH